MKKSKNFSSPSRHIKKHNLEVIPARKILGTLKITVRVIRTPSPTTASSLKPQSSSPVLISKSPAVRHPNDFIEPIPSFDNYLPSTNPDNFLCDKVPKVNEISQKFLSRILCKKPSSKNPRRTKKN